jgi:hypothetical protein
LEIPSSWFLGNWGPYCFPNPQGPSLALIN